MDFGKGVNGRSLTLARSRPAIFSIDNVFFFFCSKWSERLIWYCQKEIWYLFIYWFSALFPPTISIGNLNFFWNVMCAKVDMRVYNCFLSHCEFVCDWTVIYILKIGILWCTVTKAKVLRGRERERIKANSNNLNAREFAIVIPNKTRPTKK